MSDTQPIPVPLLPDEDDGELRDRQEREDREDREEREQEEGL